jgi:steroid delta-isomerase-like uncharacterized protein
VLRAVEGRIVTIEENKQVVSGLFAPLGEILARHDELYGPDWVGRFPGFPPLDAEGHRQYSIAMLTAFSDLDRRIEDMFAEGDKVVARWSAEGTHDGDFQGLPPTGKYVVSSGITVFRIEDNRVVEEWSESDMIGLLQQVGALPAPADASSGDGADHG